MWKYIVVFFAVFFTDVASTYYLKAVQNNKPLIASVWATVVTLTASIVVIEYTTNNYMLIPALMGAFVGTYVGMKFKK